MKINKTIADAAQTIYGEVMQIIDGHVIHENPATDPRIDPSCLEALCCELDTHFADKYGVDTQRKPLNAYTWDEIKAIADAGKAADVFKVGDEKITELYTGETVTLVILGFNHDNKADGGKAAITFGVKDIIDGWYEFNAPVDGNGNNVGGWDKSKMRGVYMRRLFRLLPTDLQAVVTPVKKITSAGGGSTELYKSIDDLFLLSLAEIYSHSAIETSNFDAIKRNAKTYNAEGEQYEFWQNAIGNLDPNDNDEALIKYMNGSADFWWLRSPYVDDVSFAWCVGGGGYAGGDRVFSGCGVSFGFCV